MLNQENIRTDDLFAAVSFGGGGGGGGGGASNTASTSTAAMDGHFAANTAMNGRDPTQIGYNAPYSGGFSNPPAQVAQHVVSQVVQGSSITGGIQDNCSSCHHPSDPFTDR